MSHTTSFPRPPHPYSRWRPEPTAARRPSRCPVPPSARSSTTPSTASPHPLHRPHYDLRNRDRCSRIGLPTHRRNLPDRPQGHRRLYHRPNPGHADPVACVRNLHQNPNPVGQRCHGWRAHLLRDQRRLTDPLHRHHLNSGLGEPRRYRRQRRRHRLRGQHTGQRRLHHQLTNALGAISAPLRRWLVRLALRGASLPRFQPGKWLRA